MRVPLLACLCACLCVGAGAQGWTDARVAEVLAPYDYVLLVERDGATAVWTHRLTAQDAFLPCSTFKLPHALVALDTGVVVLGKDRRHCEPRECHSAHGEIDLAGAIRESCISYFRQTARAIGPARMAAGLGKLGYPATGTPTTGMLEPLDGFWLTGGMRITAEQQLRWIRRFFTEPLPVKAEHLAAVRAATRRAPAGGCLLEGKTGAAREGLGWFVGQITREGHASWVTVLLKGKGASGSDAERRLRVLLERAVW
ncbi:penicillin-binding transpeptidase domain-containing protein [Geothrix sp. 21YS21S-4]|uniref:penicillin-binding transpeptidase domain-containing protein n=1 Tax=Geothrix sp. 21YS21S-4 TaxID=3068889 RepID=UPI0027B8F555|nr:penicillin-binding transpeptidase domain-containing protein [Geothrix sp. 21YS21S-4]